MPNRNVLDARRYMRLREEFLAAFDWTGIKRDSFCKWASKTREPAIPIRPHCWHVLRTGQAVEARVMEAFSEYISDVLLRGKYPLSRIAIECDHDSTGAKLDPTRTNWPALLSFIANQFFVPDESYCENEDDVAFAVRMMMLNHAEKSHGKLNEAEAIPLAEASIGTTREKLVENIISIWKKNENTVVFPIMRIPGGFARIGVSIVLPLTTVAYNQFRAGKLDVGLLDSTSIDPRSKNLFIMCVSENPEADHRYKARAPKVQAITAAQQLASICLPLHKRNRDPRIISDAGFEESMHRLNSYGFKPTGTYTRITGKPIMEYAPPMRSLGRGYPLALGHYLALKAILLIYQASQMNLMDD